MISFAAEPALGTSLLKQGLIDLQHGQLGEARLALEQASRQEPNNPLPWTSLAEVYFRLKEPKLALAAAQHAEKTSAGNPAVCHALAMYYSEAGDYARAARLEETYARSPTADPNAWSRVAGLYLNAGDAPSALTIARRLATEHPSPLAEAQWGRALTAAGEPTEGSRHIESAWVGAPTDAAIAFDFSQVLLRGGDFTKAAEVLNGALVAHPRDAQLNLALGVARYGQRRFDDSLLAFLKVIQIDPGIAQPYDFIGRMLDQAGPHLDEVVQDFRKRSAREPRNARAQLLLAEALLARGSAAVPAETLLRRSIALDAGDWEAHYQLGTLLSSKHDYPGAAVELSRSIRLDPKQPMPHYHLARVYDRLGKADRAQAERETHARLIASP